MDDYENEELNEEQNEDSSFGTYDGEYDDYNVNPDNNKNDNLDNNQEEDNEEEKAKDIENKTKNDGQYKGKNNNTPVNNAKSGVQSKNPLDNIKNMFSKGGGAKDATKDKAKEAAKQAAKKAGKAVKKAMLHLIKFLFTPPILWFTLAVIAIALIIALILLIVAMATSAAGGAEANMDPANGTFGTSLGITGDMFYGARYIYLDPEKSQQDLKDYYLAFSEDFLEQIYTIGNIDLNVNVDQENATLEMSKMIAKAVSGSTEELTLEEYIVLVDHFGYTNLELETIQENLVDYVDSNQNTLLLIQEEYSGNLKDDLTSTFTTTFANYNVTSPLYYVKDVILEDSPEAMIPSQDPKNYIAFMFMPRKEVYMGNSSYAFYFPEGDITIENYATQVQFDFIPVVDGEEVVYYTTTADPSWWQDNTSQKLAEVSFSTPYLLNEFTSIDASKPIIDKSIYSVLFNEDDIADLENVKKYFTPTEIVAEDLNYYEISYTPYNDSTYVYIKLTGDGVFQFCEYETECIASDELG